MILYSQNDFMKVARIVSTLIFQAHLKYYAMCIFAIAINLTSERIQDQGEVVCKLD